MTDFIAKLKGSLNYFRFLGRSTFWISLERAVLTIAAVAALFPLYEFWSERDERRYNRLVQAVIAQNGCQDIWATNLSNILNAWREEEYYGGGLPSHIDPTSDEAEQWYLKREQDWLRVRNENRHSPATLACFRLLVEDFFFINEDVNIEEPTKENVTTGYVPTQREIDLGLD